MAGTHLGPELVERMNNARLAVAEACRALGLQPYSREGGGGLVRHLVVREGLAGGDLLLNWHMSSNAFLYQSDHLSLPGAAASPSLMAIGMLSWMADLAEAVGEPEPARPWRRRADYMRREVVRRLWLEKAPTGRPWRSSSMTW